MSTRSKARGNKRKRSETDESEIVETKRSTNEPSPIRMGNLVEKILSFLDGSSVKAARQVNKLWSVEGAKILIAKCYLLIPSDLRNEKSSTQKKSMQKFKAFLSYKSSDVSMIPKITVKTDADLELWKSLGVLGPEVNSIKLTNIAENQELLKKVLDLLPNLKYLNLGSKLYWNYQGINIMKILTSAMSKPEKNGKMLVISFMSIRPSNVEKFEEIEKLSDCNNIKIEELKFGMIRSLPRRVSQYAARYADIISKFLSTNQSTLQILELRLSDTILPLIQFPCLTALKTMLLALRSTRVAQYRFSPCFQFSEKVPNLKNVNVNCKYLHADVNFFETTGSAPSVKTLSYTGSPEGLSVGPPFQHFPNINRFRMYDAEKNVFHNLCEQAGNIKWLKVSINLDEFFSMVADLDSMFTGFTTKIANGIKKVPKEVDYSINNVEELRVNPSILDLKELESLRIEFTGTGRKFLPGRTLAFAAKYAFKLMPKRFKIYIDVVDTARAIARAKTALDEVSKLPNVTVKFVEKAN